MKYRFSDFLPLAGTIAGIGALTALFVAAGGYTCPFIQMHIFMGCWMLVFAGLKVLNPHEFAYAFAAYDPLAQRSIFYGYIYPYIELWLAFFYLTGTALVPAYIITIVIMSITSWGVLRALSQPKPLVCACMGASFRLPLTVVSLLENILMIGMAAYMLARHAAY